MFNALSEKRIRKYLKAEGITPQVFKTLPSTNDYLVSLGKEGAEFPNLIVAENQTEGRGRRGKSFHSPDKTGLYFSLLIREETKDLTIAAAVATVRAIKKTTGIQVGIKWVNDIYLENKKIAGILAESHKDSGGLPFVVLGIGINLYPPKGGFPDEIKNIAGSLLKKRKFGLRERLVAEITNELFKTLKKRSIIYEYKENLIHLGKKIYVGGVAAACVDVLENGNLLIINQEGEEEIISSGEISIKL